MSCIQPSDNNDKEFPSWVRNWIHYDTLVTDLTKQASNARKVRDDYEDKIIASLSRRKMTNSVLQVNQGKYKVVEESHNNGLTLTNLEKLLHTYYKVRGGGAGTDETEQIMAFIKHNRGQSHSVRLKKIQ